jgi:PAS domain S-box-containing protein
MGAKQTLRTKSTSPDLSSLCLAVTERAPSPMVTVEGQGHTVRYVNPAFCRLLSKDKEQLVGRPLEQVLPEMGKWAKLLDRVYQTGEPESYTERQLAKPKQLVWSYAMWPVVADGRPVGVLITVTETTVFHAGRLAVNEALVLGSVRQHELVQAADLWNARLQEEIIERKRVESALRRAQALLKDRAGLLEGLVDERTSELTQTNKQLEAFVYSIAHDLRAPLRAMEGFSSMLVEEVGASLSDTAMDYADRINKAARFMDTMLVDLLAFSRISRQNVELAPADLKSIVDAVFLRLREDIQKGHAHVESTGPWPVVLAHEPTLAQVLFNLVSNALRFVATGVPPAVRVWAEERGEFTRVWVEDNGPGIAPDNQDQIFRLFTRLDGDKYAGTGIGLAIVSKGVERMGGHAGVESVLGRGSRFWFELRNTQ